MVKLMDAKTGKILREVESVFQAELALKHDINLKGLNVVIIEINPIK